MGPVRGVIESMNGARFVHDTLEELGREALIAVKGLSVLHRLASQRESDQLSSAQIQAA